MFEALQPVLDSHRLDVECLLPVLLSSQQTQHLEEEAAVMGQHRDRTGSCPSSLQVCTQITPRFRFTPLLCGGQVCWWTWVLYLLVVMQQKVMICTRIRNASFTERKQAHAKLRLEKA